MFYNAFRLIFFIPISLALMLLSSFTGLAYTDLKKLRVNDITQSEDGSWWIHIHRQKTGTLSSVRLLDIPLKIIEKYREQRKDDKVFNLYSRTYFIMLAHQLGEVYGFELTFHKARHNFGTHIPFHWVFQSRQSAK